MKEVSKFKSSLNIKNCLEISMDNSTNYYENGNDNMNKLNNLSSNIRKKSLYNPNINQPEISTRRVSKFNLNKNQPNQRNQTQPSLLYKQNERIPIVLDSPFINLINQYKNLVQKGIENSKFFIKTEVLNSKPENEKYCLDKLLKINFLCGDIESLGTDLMYLKSQSQLTPNFIKIESEEENESEIINNNVIHLASDRRQQIYDRLFQNIKNTFDEILMISKLEENKNNYKTQDSQKTIILDQTQHSFVNIDAIDKLIKNQISPKINITHTNENVILQNSFKYDDRSIISNNSSKDDESKNLKLEINSTFGLASRSSSCELDEVIGSEIHIPTSRIKNVTLETPEEQYLEKSILLRQITKKDKLIHNYNLVNQANTKNISNDDDSECKESENNIKSFYSSQNDISIFLKARKELELHTKN